jgi:uncharacterized protein
MDDAGITVQVLSITGPGPVPGADGVSMAREFNDYLAASIARHPDRFAGFAALPMQSSDACVDELRRSVRDLGFYGAMVNGTTEGRFLDHPSYDGLFAAAVEPDGPIHIHPHIPPEPVRQAYFSDLPEGASGVLETAGWGWHSETAVHLLRMVLAGTLDRHPRLKLIIGHMGEMLPMMLDRAADRPGPREKPAGTFENRSQTLRKSREWKCIRLWLRQSCGTLLRSCCWHCFGALQPR